MERVKYLIKMITQHSQESLVSIQLLVSFLIAVIGGWSNGLRIFVILIFLDYVAGFLRAAKCGNLNSTVGFNGLIKKTGYFVILALFFQMGDWVGNTNGQALFVRNLVVNIFIMNEAVSVLENLKHLGEDEYLPHGVVELLEGVLAEDIRKQLKDLPNKYES